MNGTHPIPAPSMRELARPKGVTEGVSFVGSSTPPAPDRPFPAPSLRELSSDSETEGVYYDERNRSKNSEFIMTGV